MKISKPRGTQDYLAQEYFRRRELENQFIEFFGKEKNYIGIETPIFEQRNLFVRSVGDETDIVQKELFDLEKKSDEPYSLRPELTAGIIRSLIENGLLMTLPKPINVFATGACFRYERPQKGRKRQFNQLDLESIGKDSAQKDAEFIDSIVEFLNKIGIEKVTLNINSFGSMQTKNAYSNTLKQYLQENSSELCDTCQARLQRNPLRVLDCKNQDCQRVVDDAPKIKLEAAEKDNFEELISILEKSSTFKGKNTITIDSKLVRGLDYYTGVVFEFISEGDESRMSSIGGGGRYNGLIKELDGPDLPALGVGLGFERLIETISEKF